MPSLSSKARRPKPGTGFLLVRLIGWFLRIIGLLLMLAALIGFIAVLVKMSPEFLEAFQFAEQKMAGFFILIVLTWLFVFVLLGCMGIVFVGIGFAFGRWGTEPATPSTLQSSTASTSA